MGNQPKKPKKPKKPNPAIRQQLCQPRRLLWGGGEDYRLGVDQIKDAGEDFAVTINLAKAKSGQNQVVAKIVNILQQFAQSEKAAKVNSYQLLVCEVCKKTVTNQKQLEMHAQSSHGQIMYKCLASST